MRTIDGLMVPAEIEHISGLVALIDFEKAFDSIEWSFLFKCLKTLILVNISSHGLQH